MKELLDSCRNHAVRRGTIRSCFGSRGLPDEPRQRRRPVRVLIDYRPALRHRTGVGEYIHRVAEALAASDDLSVSVFSSSWKDRLDPAVVDARWTTFDRRIPVRVLNFLWHRCEWPSVERLTGRQFDVVHSAHPLLLPSRTAAQVVTIHDLDFLSHPERTRAEIRRDYPDLVHAHATRADAIVVSSRYAALQVSQTLGIDSADITVCPGGAPDWPARTRPPSGGHILFMGTLEPRKNVGTLLDAYERLVARHPSAPPLILAGTALPEAAPWLARLTEPPLAGRVRHVGYVDRYQQRRLYDQAAALALPSLEEGFGFPALEAMVVGVPVVASDRGALPEVVGDAGLLVTPDRADDLADALARVLFERKTAETLVARGLARARRYTWKATADAVIAAYSAAMERRRQREPDADRH